MTIVLARRWWGSFEAKWAPVFFLSFAMVTEIGGRLQIDPLLTALCTGALLLGTWPSEKSTHRNAALITAGFLTGLGALAKGPVAWVNTGLVALIWLVLFRKGSERSRFPAWVWILTILAAVGPVLIWAVRAAEVEPRLWNALFYDQHVGRVVKADRHPGPIWKSAVRLPLFLTPWFFLILSGVLSWFRTGKLRLSRINDRGFLRALSWVLVLVVFYSLIPPKRDLYLLPIYPAAALLAARALSGGIEILRPWVRRTNLGLLLVLGGAVMVSGFFITEVPGLKTSGFLAGLALIIGSSAAEIAASKGDFTLWASRTATGWLCFSILITLLVFPPLNEKKSARLVALDLAGMPENPLEIPFVGRVRPEGYRFYSGIPAVYSEDLSSHLERDGKDFLGVIARSKWKELPDLEKKRYRIIRELQVGGKKMLILGSNENRSLEDDRSLVTN